MLTPHWLMRMSHWARRPPPRGRVVLVLVVVGVCAGLYAIEAIWGWPEALTPERTRRPVIR